MNLNNPMGLFVLVAIAIGSGYLLLRNTEDIEKPDTALRLGIGYYMNDATLIGTGEDGAVLYKMTAAKAVQDLNGGAVNLTDVRVIYDPATEVAWDLYADTGHIPPDSTLVYLEGNVVAETRDEVEAPMTIRTEFMELDIDNYIAETPRKVTIVQLANKVVATGMRAYFKEDRLQLLADVNGKFAP
jgi:lipopolysaccharide export system protein LptC